MTQQTQPRAFAERRCTMSYCSAYLRKLATDRVRRPSMRDMEVLQEVDVTLRGQLLRAYD